VRRPASVSRRQVAGVLLLPLVVLAGCGGGKATRPTAAGTTTTAAVAPPRPVPAFAIGIDERNPHLLAPGPQPAPFDRFRDALVALRPSYVRVLVDWSVVQPDAARPPDWTQPQDGCDRGVPPCAPYAGTRDRLRAVRALGAQPVILIYGTPAWAARPPAGCERPGVTPYARMPRLAPYRQLIESLLALGRSERIALPYWSAWNEPNTPTFLNPQRADCGRRSRSLAAGRYAQLARALAGEVGLGHMLLGEAAGLDPHTHATGAAELARDLPGDLVCGAAAWSQHAYVSAARDRGRTVEAVHPAHTTELLASVERALAGHHCGHAVPVWITETGAGDRPGACAAMAAQLRAWRRDPEVRAAFQYTLRDDPLFPVGLADAGLTRLYPAYAAWRTRGDTRC
jgi:hypothetical protein